MTHRQKHGPSTSMIALCVGLAVVLLVGAVFWSVLTAGLVDRDDRHYVHEVGDIWSGTWHEALAAFGRVHHPSHTGGYYQPLTALSFMLDARLLTDYASRSFQFHFTNLLLHLLNTAILFALIRRLSGSNVWATLLTLVFALHPVQVESVAWIAQRMTLLATLFSLLALVCYVRYVAAVQPRECVRAGSERVPWTWLWTLSDTGGGAPRRRLAVPWLIAVILFYSAAVLSKPTFLGLPVVLLILDVWPFRRNTWRPVLEKVPLFLLMFAFGFLQLALHADTELTQAAAGGLQRTVQNVASFAIRIVWPARVAPAYPMVPATDGRSLQTLADAGVVLLMAVTLCGSFRRSRPMFVALAGALVLTLPALLQMPFTDQLLGDQYLYAALMMPLIAIAAWIRSQSDCLHKPWGRCLALFLASTAAVCAVQSYGLSFIWHDSRTLHRYVIDRYPSWSRGYLTLVKTLVRQNDFDAALYYAEKAVQADPGDPSAWFYLGTVLLQHQDGRSREAIEPLRKALASDPDWPECLRNLGMALAQSGRFDEAIQYLERARDLRPHSVKTRVGLGHAYLKVDRAASARREFQLALKQGNDAMAHWGLAMAWAANNEVEYARRHLAAAVAQDNRLAARAARSPVLRRLWSEPGFEVMADVPDQESDPKEARSYR